MKKSTLNKINNALETLVEHTDNVLRDKDGSTDYIFYEVPITNRTDIALHFYDRGNYKDLASTTCDHCHKPFFLIDKSKENPKDVCHCVYERTINPYHGGFSYINKTECLYNEMFNSKTPLHFVNTSTQKPLDPTNENDWINKHGNKVTISRDFGPNVSVERNLTLGIKHIIDEYNNRPRSVMRHVDQDKPEPKE